ncbi:MAG: hypothetical protein CMJ31_14335 [Phycisphaerae bacterium]|nr:hypothetical protein [Phycisphaerae bacterium]
MRGSGFIIACLAWLSGARSISWAAESHFQATDAESDVQRQLSVMPDRALVIAHRGASDLLPEHTLAAYAAAYVMGADYIEPDVVLTKDGVLVCSHDVTLDETTDIADRFPGRARGDGKHYVIDFTLDELRTIDRVARSDGDEPGDISGRHRVTTLVDMARMIQRLNAKTGRTVGIIPEAKQPAFHRENGRPIEPILVRALAELGYESKSDPCIVQCFDLDAIDTMVNGHGCSLRMVWLVSNVPDRSSLERAKAMCVGLGPKRSLVAMQMATVWIPSAFTMTATQMGFELYPWTFGDEPEAMKSFSEFIHVQGFFTNNPDVAVEALTPN